MTAPHDDAATDLQAINVHLRAELDAALAQKEALASRLAQRDVAYEERIAHQSAATAVLKAMSASPGDPQSVFDLIAIQAQKLCESDIVTIWEYDGAMFYLRAVTTNGWPSAAIEAYRHRFPMPAKPDPENGAVTAILEKRITHVRDPAQDKGIAPAVQALFDVQSGLGVPMIRDNRAVGAIMLASRRKGGYSDAQIELLKTFADQAVIAITSAETYRALQTRTADLQEALEQRTAAAELLQVINASRAT